VTCFVYVLGSTGAGGYRTYVGWTTDLDRRLARHNGGTGARSTRGRIWALLYAERHPTRETAMSREWYLKRDRAFRRTLTVNCGDSQVAVTVVGCGPSQQETTMAAKKKKSSTKVRANRRKAKGAAKERRRRARSEKR
jgi:putative endonuclease